MKHVADVLRRNGIRMFATVPDYIVSHVLEHLWADPECHVVTVAREEEGVGLLSGPGSPAGVALLMQNSGLGNCVNALASLCVGSRPPVRGLVPRGPTRRWRAPCASLTLHLADLIIDAQRELKDGFRDIQARLDLGSKEETRRQDVNELL